MYAVEDDGICMVTHSSVAGGTEGLRHALVGASKHVAAGAHGAPDEHWLPRQLVVHWDQGVVRGEGAG